MINKSSVAKREAQQSRLYSACLVHPWCVCNVVPTSPIPLLVTHFSRLEAALVRFSFQREVVSKILKSLKRLILEQKCQERVKVFGKVFLNLEKGKKLSVLKLSLVLLYSFKQLFSHQSSFPHIAISFFLFCVTESIHDG